MQLQLVRHATLLVTVMGKRILVDPMLGEAGGMARIPMSANGRRNPLVPLPMALSDVLRGVDAIIITHLHPDHLDDAAAAMLPKDVPIFCQPGDDKKLKARGFRVVQPIRNAHIYQGIELVRTGGKHGKGLIGRLMGRVSGFVLRAPGEPTLYLAGDTIWCDHVREALEIFHPQVTVVNAGGAQFVAGAPITMTGDDIVQVCRTGRRTTVVAVHMDAINHCLHTRDQLRTYLQQQDLLDQVIIPADGDTLTF